MESAPFDPIAGRQFDARNCPTLQLSHIRIPAFVIPPLVVAILTISTRPWNRGATTRSANEKLDGRTLSGPPQEERWVAPNLQMKLWRITMFLAPTIFFFCLTNFCASCLCWVSAVSALPDTSPAVNRNGIAGGVTFLIFWAIASCLAWDRQRAYRSPIATLKSETSFGASVALFAIVVLMLAWVFARVFHGVV